MQTISFTDSFITITTLVALTIYLNTIILILNNIIAFLTEFSLNIGEKYRITKKSLAQLLDSVDVEVSRAEEAKALQIKEKIIIPPNSRAITSEEREKQARIDANPNRRRKVDMAARVEAVVVQPPIGTTAEQKLRTFRLSSSKIFYK